MQRVTDQVDVQFLAQSPPRPLRFPTLARLLSDHVFERPQRALLDPLLIIAVIAAVGLIAADASMLLWIIPLGVVCVRLGLSFYRAWQRAWADLTLLRDGLIVRAYVLKLRPHRTLTGEIEGALLDCAIPVAARRTYISSIWLADGNEALRLARQGRVSVICLPRTPGTWRLIEPVQSEVRYERVGAVAQVPPDVI